MGATFAAVDRGGQMTWHGPGQTTGYVIADLRAGRRVRGFVEALVGAMADAAEDAGVRTPQPGDDAMGLYAAGRKLGSVGIRVSGGVTTHGLALNRDPDLEWFRLMTACGAPDVAATSIAAEGGDPDRRARRGRPRRRARAAPRPRRRSPSRSRTCPGCAPPPATARGPARGSASSARRAAPRAPAPARPPPR